MGLLVLGMVKLADEGVGRVRGKADWCGGGEGGGLVIIVDANGNLQVMSSVLC